MKQTELNHMIQLHKKFLNNETGGKRLELNHHNLIKLSFEFADLSGAILEWNAFFKCNLKGVDFEGAELRGSEFIECNLENTIFTKSDLRNTIFE